MGGVVCGALGCLLATPPPITLDGRGLSPVVEVWVLQEPARCRPGRKRPRNPTPGGIHPSLSGPSPAAPSAVCLARPWPRRRPTSVKGDCAWLNGLFYGGTVADTIALVQWLRDQ